MVRFIQSVLQGFPCLYAHLHTHIHRHTMLAASYQAWPSREMVPFRVFPGHFYIFTGGDGDWTAKSGFLLYDISLCQMAATTNSGEVTREAWHSMPRFMVTLHESHRFQLSRYLRYFTALLLSFRNTGLCNVHVFLVRVPVLFVLLSSYAVSYVTLTQKNS